MKARNGYIYRRIHDGQIMGDELILGFDYSTGVQRIDLIEYYEEVYNGEPWHKDTNFQIKIRPIDLIELLEEHKGMIEYTSTLKRYTDLMDNVYFYVNYFTDMEKELIERFATVTPKSI